MHCDYVINASDGDTKSILILSYPIQIFESTLMNTVSQIIVKFINHQLIFVVAIMTTQ